MKRSKQIWLVSLAITQFAFLACTPEENVSADDSEESSAAEFASVADSYSEEDIEMAVSAQAEISAEGRSLLATCATVTHSEENKQVIIDFGTGCVGPYGRTRSGKIIVTYSTTVGDGIANRIVTFENYIVNNRKISGIVNLRDIEINENDNWQSTKSLEDYKVELPNGEYIVTNGSITRELTAGSGDLILENNEFAITGSFESQNSKGSTYTHTITEAIVAKMSCMSEGGFARVSGNIEMKRTGVAGNSRVTTLDYGDGTCDGTFTITTPRRTITVSING